MKTGETIANILYQPQHDPRQALDLVGAEPLEAENSCDPDYILNGVELWYDDLDLVPDNYGEGKRGRVNGPAQPGVRPLSV